jgi:hypothetical protein
VFEAFFVKKAIVVIVVFPTSFVRRWQLVVKVNMVLKVGKGHVKDQSQSDGSEID